MSGFFRTFSGEPRGRRYLLLWVVLLCLLSLLSPSMSAADVKASVDKSAISLDQTIELALESDDESDSRPDLSALTQDFEILDRRSSHSVSIVNGKRSVRQVLVLRLRPRRAGELLIPPISFGERATEALRISVGTPAEGTFEAPTTTAPTGGANDEPEPAPSAVLEASLEPPEVYTKQQLVLTAKVLMDGPIQGSQLRDPQIPRAEILPLGEDRYQAERDGKSYRVYERRYAIFPQDPGQMEIDPLVFEGWAMGTDGRSGRGSYASPGQHIQAFSRTLIADVHRPPDGASKDNWLPARNLSLTESGPATYRAKPGQPITRRISLRADGIMARDLPVLAVPAPHQLAGQQSQPRLWDERRPEGVIGTRQETISITAQEPGRYRLPPLSLDWWNTSTSRWETAILPARELLVSAAPIAGTGLPSPDATAQQQPWRQPAQADKATEMPITSPEASEKVRATPNGVWLWIAIVLALAWIATVLSWWRSKHRNVAVTPPAESEEPPESTEETDPLQGRIDAVEAAYRAGDAGAAREALLAWAGQVLPEQTPSNLARLAQRCPQPLRDQILLLEETFFSPRPVAWDKEPVWEKLKGFVPAPPEEPASFRRGKPIRRRTVSPDAE